MDYDILGFSEMKVGMMKVCITTSHPEEMVLGVIKLVVHGREYVPSERIRLYQNGSDCIKMDQNESE